MFNLENKRDSVLIAVEEYLDNTLNVKGDASVFESSMSILAEAMERNFVQVTDVIREQLNVSTEGLIQVSESFGTSMESFDDSLNKFSVNIRDFSEFNYHLKTNIQRMNVSFADLTTGLKENTKELEALTKDIIKNN